MTDSGGSTAADEVFAAARVRAVALTSGDVETLLRLHHPDFRWLSAAGDELSREGTAVPPGWFRGPKSPRGVTLLTKPVGTDRS